jgi:hypothetical protein
MDMKGEPILRRQIQLGLTWRLDSIFIVLLEPPLKYAKFCIFSISSRIAPASNFFFKMMNLMKDYQLSGFSKLREFNSEVHHLGG